jgi:dephospho-CoA kinase
LPRQISRGPATPRPIIRPPRLKKTKSSKANTPIAVAITGGIGAGKSTALVAFARHGAAVVSSDEIVHRLLREDDEVRAAIRERLGDRVFGADGTVSRGAVAQIVFADRGQLAWLESLLHPRVAREYLQWREDLSRLPDPPAVCVTEVPLLYEVGADTRFDVVVAVTAPKDLRAQRAKVPLAERSQRLLPDEEKLRRADFAYVNDGSLEELDAFVARVMATLTSE